jgi:hypothetical protein
MKLYCAEEPVFKNRRPSICEVANMEVSVRVRILADFQCTSQKVSNGNTVAGLAV